jgi:rhodanese-related sulfurtransferase
MVNSGPSSREPSDRASRAQVELDRRLFHLQTLYEFTAEMSPVVATEKLLETFLLMVMGSFGIGQGTVLLCNRKTRQAACVGRGAAAGLKPSLEEVERYLYRGFQATAERSLAPMSVSFVTDPPAVFFETEMAATVRTAALFTVDDTLLGLLALGTTLGKPDLNEEDRELLRGLTANFMVFLKNSRAFETIQALNEDLSRTNADLRRTIAELTEARDRIRLLELAKMRLKQLVRGEIERAGRFRPVHVLLIVLTSALLALAFNFSSPNGIPVLPKNYPPAQSAPLGAAELQQMVFRGEAVLVDARPPELFSRKHIAGAINIPAALFDIIYPMKLGAVLKPDQVVAVYGRTFSKRYDAELIERLLQRHDRVSALAGGLSEWEAQGLPVGP